MLIVAFVESFGGNTFTLTPPGLAVIASLIILAKGAVLASHVGPTGKPVEKFATSIVNISNPAKALSKLIATRPSLIWLTSTILLTFTKCSDLWNPVAAGSVLLNDKNYILSIKVL